MRYRSATAITYENYHGQSPTKRPRSSPAWFAGQEGFSIYLVGLEADPTFSALLTWTNNKFRSILSEIGSFEAGN